MIFFFFILLDTTCGGSDTIFDLSVAYLYRIHVRHGYCIPKMCPYYLALRSQGRIFVFTCNCMSQNTCNKYEKAQSIFLQSTCFTCKARIKYVINGIIWYYISKIPSILQRITINSLFTESIISYGYTTFYLVLTWFHPSHKALVV